jgi:hypothetical protein
MGSAPRELWKPKGGADIPGREAGPAGFRISEQIAYHRPVSGLTAEHRLV